MERRRSSLGKDATLTLLLLYHPRHQIKYGFLHSTYLELIEVNMSKKVLPPLPLFLVSIGNRFNKIFQVLPRTMFAKANDNGVQ